jgi:hypothetical protein
MSDFFWIADQVAILSLRLMFADLPKHMDITPVTFT